MFDVEITPEAFVCERHRETLTWSPMGKSILGCPQAHGKGYRLGSGEAHRHLGEVVLADARCSLPVLQNLS